MKKIIIISTIVWLSTSCGETKDDLRYEINRLERQVETLQNTIDKADRIADELEYSLRYDYYNDAWNEVQELKRTLYYDEFFW